MTSSAVDALREFFVEYGDGLHDLIAVEDDELSVMVVDLLRKRGAERKHELEGCGRRDVHSRDVVRSEQILAVAV